MTETEELKLRKELERAAKARAVLESELFQEAMAVIEADTLEKWKASPVRDAEGQLALRLKWQIIQEIRGHLADVMTSGKMASAQLDRELTLRERMRRGLRGTFGPRA